MPTTGGPTVTVAQPAAASVLRGFRDCASPAVATVCGVDPTAFYTSGDEQHFTATGATAGPWSPGLQHGGPPSALLVRAAEHSAGTDDDLVALRCAVDFLGPVPVRPVTVHAEVRRPGRAIVGVDAELSAGGRTALRARVWLVRLGAVGPELGPPSSAPPPPDAVAPTPLPWDFPYARAVDWRVTAGDMVGAGPVAVWARQRLPLLAGEPPSGLQRAVLVADSSSGVSSVLDWDTWSFVNIDIDVHLLRPLQGPWVHLDAVTRTSGVGSGLCSATLHDTGGLAGLSVQTLVVGKR